MKIDNTLLNYCDSLSCLHALEHFGLGRYNDPIQFDGYLENTVWCDRVKDGSYQGEKLGTVNE
mgnify:CR=1 FL=1